ncbi:hypothetical protein NC653_007590 [Populus alba x Populus x berolinensis]|uniref:Uncharacterized protein n=1 Tax=Populus alba x Populus x berolinensis TaxID=444605 RepID=A0AAD6RH85_9ROSI|nr:hypothetical protein NC653_007590 [Populus alba x Populus x berolinensis]
MKFQFSPPDRTCQVFLSSPGILNLRNGPVSIRTVTSGISFPTRAYPRIDCQIHC